MGGPDQRPLNFQTGGYHHVGSVKSCVSGNRVERIAATVPLGGGLVHANLGHAELFQAARTIGSHHEPGELQWATAFQVIDHKVDPRVSLTMSIRWLQYGHRGEPRQIIDQLGAKGDLWEIEAGNYGETSVKRTLGPIHRTGGC